MATWLLKTEPGDYSFADLERDRKTVWDGVRNNLALIHIRNVKKGDRALIYHTGKERQVVGIANVTTNPYPDPERDDPRIVVFDIALVRRLKKPLPLAAVKADQRFRDFALVRLARLSVMPVPPEIERALMKLAGE